MKKALYILLGIALLSTVAMGLPNKWWYVGRAPADTSEWGSKTMLEKSKQIISLFNIPEDVRTTLWTLIQESRPEEVTIKRGKWYREMVFGNPPKIWSGFGQNNGVVCNWRDYRELMAQRIVVETKTRRFYFDRFEICGNWCWYSEALQTIETLNKKSHSDSNYNLPKTSSSWKSNGNAWLGSEVRQWPHYLVEDEYHFSLGLEWTAYPPNFPLTLVSQTFLILQNIRPRFAIYLGLRTGISKSFALEFGPGFERITRPDRLYKILSKRETTRRRNWKSHWNVFGGYAKVLTDVSQTKVFLSESRYGANQKIRVKLSERTSLKIDADYLGRGKMVDEYYLSEECLYSLRAGLNYQVKEWLPFVEWTAEGYKWEHLQIEEHGPSIGAEKIAKGLGFEARAGWYTYLERNLEKDIYLKTCGPRFQLQLTYQW